MQSATSATCRPIGIADHHHRDHRSMDNINTTAIAAAVDRTAGFHPEISRAISEANGQVDLARHSIRDVTGAASRSDLSAREVGEASQRRRGFQPASTRP